MANYSEWQLQALEDFKYSGLSYDEIGKKHGRSRDTIIKLVTRSSMQRVKPLQRHSLKRLEDKEQLSPTHRSVGVKLNLFRTIHNSLTMTECAERIGSNRYRVKAMENGVHDFTLTELQKVAELLDMTVVDLMAPTSFSVLTSKPKEIECLSQSSRGTGRSSGSTTKLMQRRGQRSSPLSSARQRSLNPMSTPETASGRSLNDEGRRE